jgi:hypothetical protein
MIAFNATPVFMKGFYLDIPMYSSKDILPQSNKAESNFIIVEKTTSTFIKFLVVVIIAIVVFTPLYQSLGVDHFI